MARKEGFSAESSEAVTKLAGKMLKHPDPAVRSLAGSVVAQFHPDPSCRPAESVPLAHERYADRDPSFWEGFWAGMWASQQARG